MNCKRASFPLQALVTSLLGAGLLLTLAHCGSTDAASSSSGGSSSGGSSSGGSSSGGSSSGGSSSGGSSSGGPVTCSDGVRNGDEVDVDCGGSCAAKCALGKACVKDGDCVTGNCATDRCAAPVLAEVSAGQRYTCARSSDGRVKCWGWNGNGQLGNGTDGDGTNVSVPGAPIALGAGRFALSVVAGIATTCAILDDHSLKCWGVPPGGGAVVNAPGAAVDLGAGRTALAVAVGPHVCAILDDHSLKCWGNNTDGQLGNGTSGAATSTIAPALPVNLGVGRTALAVGVGGAHTCAILDDRALKCWGRNESGQLGNGSMGAGNATSAPGPIVNLGAGHTALSLATGIRYTCVTLDDKTVRCWGENYKGQLGNGGFAAGVASPGAVTVGAGRTGVALSAGESHTCALLDDRSLACWGWNEFGQLGNGVPFVDVRTPGSPIAVGAGRTVLSASAGRYHTCAVLDDRSLKCWGSAQFGELGIASLAGSVHVDLPPATPVNVGF